MTYVTGVSTDSLIRPHQEVIFPSRHFLPTLSLEKRWPPAVRILPGSSTAEGREGLSVAVPQTTEHRG